MRTWVAIIALLLGSLLYAVEPGLHAYYPQGEALIEHEGYAFIFSASKHIPLCTVYRLALTEHGVNRTGMSFCKDPKVPASPSPQEYASSGYDLGHMCEASGMNKTTALMLDTFMTSNCCPQLPSLNRGDWKELESMLHKETLERGPPYFVVVCGPIFQGDIKTIGSGVAVPTAFYKMAFDEKTHTARAWIMANKNENKHPSDYETDLSEIEKQTGFKFNLGDWKWTSR